MTGPGLVVLFGSGEMSPTGRQIHEEVFRAAQLSSPIKIGILETPTGFEVNAVHGWPERMQKFFETSLTNYKPQITRIRAWKKGGENSTDNPSVDVLLNQDYLYCGAGSPGYTIRNLENTRAYSDMIKLHQSGGILCLGSATAVAVSRWAIPVYEIFKTGADLHWLNGLDLFGRYNMNLAIVPHWNNQEGKDFDTTRCYMGENRFLALMKLLPIGTSILGIDELTACIFNFAKKVITVSGKGNIHIIRGQKEPLNIAGGGQTDFSKLA